MQPHAEHFTAIYCNPLHFVIEAVCDVWWSCSALSHFSLGERETRRSYVLWKQALMGPIVTFRRRNPGTWLSQRLSPQDSLGTLNLWIPLDLGFLMAALSLLEFLMATVCLEPDSGGLMSFPSRYFRVYVFDHPEMASCY